MGVENTEYGAGARSRYWKDWKQYAKDPECISEVPPAEDFITWYMRS